MDGRRPGFTIIEVAIVLAIVGILGAIAIPKYLDYTKRNRIIQAINDIRVLQTKIRIFAAERNLPDDLISLPGAPFLDPWGNPYRYLNIVKAQSHF